MVPRVEPKKCTICWTIMVYNKHGLETSRCSCRPGREWRAIACARPHTRQKWVRRVVIARLHFNGECGVKKLFSSFLENSWITRNTFFCIADAQDIELIINLQLKVILWCEVINSSTKLFINDMHAIRTLTMSAILFMYVTLSRDRNNGRLSVLSDQNFISPFRKLSKKPITIPLNTTKKYEFLITNEI